MKKIRALVVVFLVGITSVSYAAKVDTLQIASTAMGKTYKAAVVLPNTYAKSKSTYPVMYLLHGAYGHFSDWLKNTPNKKLVQNLSDQYNMIIVMPEGETFSFYLDSPMNKESQFETFITQEVIQKVDKTYRTISNRNGRVITGLSMGGHGALYLSGRHPDLFCAAGSMSGAVDMSAMLNRDSSTQVIKLMQPVFGDKSSNSELYEQNSVLAMTDKLKANKLPLIIDCGVNDFLIEPNRELHRRLVYNKVDHDYTERPGAHTWDYWENSLPYHVLFFNKILLKNQVVSKK
ncbi:alpha/beta hydrolase family protein [Flavobacterium sp. Fl-318]|uniref:Alpha/beta hydrolase family protein n=1 Tax=Flavobacterium cupriresistens TaxID=2893885 RepID=A0ABU4R718_9FLAO|nr:MULTISPECIES: alpha/beta hydrolase family protein [unclassified Flavobacterium]MDX6188390.1 alpha/beta hydrolase family protein [Flavobacterium sp. Fl-318]UFH44939.1 esterase family protein [Flavobacterium sp. F-323]